MKLLTVFIFTFLFCFNAHSTNISGYSGNFQPAVSAVIPSSGTTTPAVTLNGFTLVGIKVPATFTGTALTFTMCDTLAGTYVAVTKSDGSAVSYTVAASKYVAIDPKDFYGINFLKIVSGSTEGAARTLVVSLKGF